MYINRGPSGHLVLSFHIPNQTKATPSPPVALSLTLARRFFLSTNKSLLNSLNQSEPSK